MYKLIDEMEDKTPTGVEFKTIELTREIADDLLSRNHDNRPQKIAQIEKYARDMKSGNWVFNGVPIVINADGRVLDAQHRLEAFKLAGCPRGILTQVVQHPSERSDEVFQSLDQGLTRRASDYILKNKNCQYIETICRTCVEYTIKCSNGSVRVSNSEILNFYNEHKELVDRITSIKNFRCFCNLFSSKLIGVALRIGICENKVDEIFGFMLRVYNVELGVGNTLERALFMYMNERTDRTKHKRTLQQKKCALVMAIEKLLDGVRYCDRLISHPDHVNKVIKQRGWKSY